MPLASKTVRKALLAAALLAVAGEIAVRVAERLLYGGRVGALTSVVVLEEDYWKLRPGAVVVQPERDGDIVYTANDRGFRGRDHTLPSGAFRVVFLGDSVTFALGTNDGTDFPSVLERTWNARSARAVEVFNLGIHGFAPRHERRVLERYGLPLEPDLVVLQLHLNDFLLDRALDPETPDREPGEELRYRLRAIQALWYRVVNRSALYRRARQALVGPLYALLHERRRMHFPESLDTGYLEALRAGFAAHPDDAEFPGFDEVVAMRELAEERGSGFFVFLMPLEPQLFRTDFDDLNARIAAGLAARGVDLYDPLPELRASPIRTRLLVDGIHFSEAGHVEMAALLEARLADAFPDTPVAGAEGSRASRSRSSLGSVAVHGWTPMLRDRS